MVPSHYKAHSSVMMNSIIAAYGNCDCKHSATDDGGHKEITACEEKIYPKKHPPLQNIKDTQT